jgi:hypothetical protein
LSLAYLIQHDDLQFNPFSCKWHILFFFTAENTHISWYVCVYIYNICFIYNIFFIHSSVVGHLCWFHSVTVVNRAALDMGIQVSFLYIGLHSFRYMPKSGMVGL